MASEEEQAGKRKRPPCEKAHEHDDENKKVKQDVQSSSFNKQTAAVVAAAAAPAKSIEEKSISEGQQRVKFQVERLDKPFLPKEEEWKPLARALETSESLGAALVCPIEGFVFGNGAVLCSGSEGGGISSIVVSKSGRFAGTEFTRQQFVRVVDFDNDSWKAKYVADDNEKEANSSDNTTAPIKPSSDTPLLWNALVIAPNRFSWKLKPKFVLHGHSCASKEEADAKGFPCSTHETLFSTPDDLKALMELLEQYPYPMHKVFVRKNHGFFLLAQDEQEACRIFEEKLAPIHKKEHWRR